MCLRNDGTVGVVARLHEDVDVAITVEVEGQRCRFSAEGDRLGHGELSLAVAEVDAKALLGDAADVGHRQPIDLAVAIDVDQRLVARLWIGQHALFEIDRARASTG